MLGSREMVLDVGFAAAAGPQVFAGPASAAETTAQEDCEVGTFSRK
jgi:hypothetical protein